MGTFDFLKIDGERWKVKNLCVMCEKRKGEGERKKEKSTSTGGRG